MEGQDTVNSKTEPIKVPRFIEISERTIDDVDNIPYLNIFTPCQTVFFC